MLDSPERSGRPAETTADGDRSRREAPVPPVASGRTRGERREHAIVLGASIAGVLAARALAETFERVTILERDALSDARDRRGVPQGRHVHALMDRGRQVMEELFPGLTADLVAQGVPTTEWLHASRWYLGGRPMRQASDTGLTLALASRSFLENELRTRTEALANVRIRRQATAAGLIMDSTRKRVVGVRVSVAAQAQNAEDAQQDRPVGSGRIGLSAARDQVGQRGADGIGAAATEELFADLVVDASGRGSRTPAWLAEFGYEQPSEDRVIIDLGYSSRLYRREPDQLDGDLALIASSRPGSRGGAVVALEGDRWHVTLSGTLGDHPPAEPGAFEDYASTLFVPDIHQITQTAEPLSAPVPHRFRGSLRRHYERLAAPPLGLVAVGDAVCSFNPLYAQGMSVAAQEALALRDYLAPGGAISPREFYRRIGRLIDVAWELSTAADLRWPGVEGRRSIRTRIFGAYFARAQAATSVDPDVTRAFLRVVNLTRPPTTLLAPAMMNRVRRSGATLRATPAPVP